MDGVSARQHIGNACSRVAGTLLHDTENTSVYRQGGTPGTIWKEYRGNRAAARLERERSILARLAGTEGIVQLAEGASPPSALGLKDCGHESLAELLRDGPLDTRALLSLAEKLASALASVHRAGVIHRDINPSNIMVVRGAPVLIDFDMALLPEDGAPASEEPMAGTLPYMAPEQAGRSRHRADPRSDLYSLGATLYEMATGRPPFESTDILQLLHAHSATEPLAPVVVNQRVPLAVSEIIRKLLAKNPDERYQGAEGLAFDVRQAMAAIETGAQVPIALGTRDFGPLFAAPADLVGRGESLESLRAAFADARRGKVRVVLVEGEAGVGKTALVHELKPMVAAAGGRFVAGKFDQLQRAAAPESGLSHALAAVAQLLLAEPEENLQRHREAMAGRVGANAALLVDAVPEFVHVVGAQSRPPGLDPTESAARLLDAAAGVLAALASPESALVVFLDDLQWAGGLSLQLVERMLHETSVAGLLVVGAFRGSEATEPFAAALRRWQESSNPPRRIPLDNLPAAAVIELLARTMRVPAARAEELAATLHVLTAGNPFDTLETLNALRREGVLRLGAEAWEWDSGAVLCFGSGDVVELLAKRIVSLPESSRALLGCMARLGNHVQSALLQAATGHADAAMEQAIRPSLADGLVLEERGEHASLRFRHDRVQQAALVALDPHEGGQLHLSMARRLAAHPEFQVQAAQQYFACAADVRDPAEKRSVALLFRAVAERLRDAAEFEQCEQYLACASQLLDHPSDARLRFAIDTARHLALYSLGRFEELDLLYVDLWERSPDPLELVDATCLQVRSFDARVRMADSLALGRRLLGQMGLELPPRFLEPDADEGLDSFGDWLRRDRASGRLPGASAPPPHVLGIAKLLSRMVRSSYMKRDWDALTCLTLQARKLWTQHGPSADLVLAMVRSSNLIISRRKDFRTAYDVQRHVLEVAEALQCEPQVFECRHVFSCYARPRFEPIEHCQQAIRRASDDLRTRGDMSLSCYLECSAVELEFDYSPTLDTAEASANAAMNLCARTRNGSAASILLPEIQVMRAMRGLTRPGTISDAGFDEEEYLRDEDSRHPLSRCVFCVRRAFASTISGDSELAAVHAQQAMERIDAIPGHFLAVKAHLMQGLGLAGRLRRHTGTPEDRARLVAGLDAEVAWLADCARDNPLDALHFLRFLEAERAWACGDRWQAVVLFDTAVAESDTRRGMWQRALVRERAAGFHFQNGMPARGRELLEAARDIYLAWGATGKVRALHDANAWLAGPSTGAARSAPNATAVQPRQGSSASALTPDTVDLMGILGASQALSSETSFDRLCMRVVDTLAAMTGATKVSLLSCHDDGWWLLTPAAHRPCIPLAEAAAARLVPMSAVAYAQRTGESFVVDNVVADERFTRDLYFAAQPHTSLLVVAIGKPGALRAMLVLENSLAHSVFNASRLDAVKLVAGQLAVSLANAQLYDRLEQRVQERTRDLQQAQAQLVSTARKAGMAEVANSVLHNVGNVLNSINVSAAYARRAVHTSRSASLAGVARLLEEHAQDLAEFLTRDPKGKVVPGYLGKLSDALAQEREALLEHLDRLGRSVDHVNAVIATQQSHAGRSSVREPVQVGELIDEALSLSSAAGSDRGTVVRQFAPLPPMQLDRARVLQILVNLVTNAWQAMDKLPGASRKLTLGSGMLQEDGKEVLRITVRDEGEGIAPANLAKVFAQGFTTKPGGHGFGLHGSAVAAIEMGGTLTAQSDGPGTGSVFTLELPAAQAGANP